MFVMDGFEKETWRLAFVYIKVFQKIEFSAVQQYILRKDDDESLIECAVGKYDEISQ